VRHGVLGRLALLRHGRRVDEAIARAFPALDRAARRSIARRGAALQARLATETIATEDAVALCRRLAIDGGEWLPILRQEIAARRAVCFTAPFGAPALAARGLALYGGPGAPAPVSLPSAGTDEESFELLGRAIRCSTAALAGRAEPTLVVPIFGSLAPDRRLRLAFHPPLPDGLGPRARTAAALAVIAREVERAPEAWHWADEAGS
jgi:lauroyl/myristoyl acyltransferase